MVKITCALFESGHKAYEKRKPGCFFNRHDVVLRVVEP